MQDLNEIFKRMNDEKKERKRIQDIYKDLLANSKPYQDAVDALSDAKTKKQQIEASIRAEMPTEMDELDRLKQSLDANKQMLTDLALTKMMKGETVEIVDEQETTYEPIFSVRFKKSG